jgi:hypothetical protein
VQDVGLRGADGPAVLAWAAENERIVLTHDRATMPDFADARISKGQATSGMFVLNDRMAVGLAIQEILMIVDCSEQHEWKERVVRLPL